MQGGGGGGGGGEGGDFPKKQIIRHYLREDFEHNKCRILFAPHSFGQVELEAAECPKHTQDL